MEDRDVTIDYTNWRGERRMRKIRPLNIVFRASSWHPQNQWLLSAIDLEDGEVKEFALKDIAKWIASGEPVPS